MGRHFQVEIHHGHYRQAGTEEVGLVEGADFGNVSAGQHADADAHVPRGEVGRGGRAALAVGRQVDEQGVVGGKHGAEADAQQQGDGEEHHRAGLAVPADDVHARGQQEEAEHHQHQSCGYDLRNLASVHQSAREEARHRHTQCHEGEEEARGGVYLDLAGIHGHVVGRHAVGDGQEQEAGSGRQTLEQDEAVERDGVALHGRLVGCLDQRGATETGQARTQRGAEYPRVADARIVQEEACHGADGHGDVVGQSVVAQPFAAARRGHDVDDHRVAAHRHHAERHAVDDAQGDEEGQGAGQQIAPEDGREDEVGHQVEGLAGERVEQVAREGADA